MPPRATAKAMVLILVIDASPSDGMGASVEDGNGKVQVVVLLVVLLLVVVLLAVGVVVDVASDVVSGASDVVSGEGTGVLVVEAAAGGVVPPQYSVMKDVTSSSLTEPVQASTTAEVTCSARPGWLQTQAVSVRSHPVF